MSAARRVRLVDPRIGSAVEAVLTGRLTLLQRRALAELLVVTARPGGEHLATVHDSAVDALAGGRARRSSRERDT